GVLSRSGLHRVLAWPFLFKNYAIRDLAELLEIYGMPIRLGKFPPGTGDKEKATLLRAVTELGHAAAGIIPETMQIEFKDAASGSHDPFMAVVTWADQCFSKGILGGTLTTQADGKSSTNALGKVHNEVRREILTSDSRQLAATLTRDLLYPLAVLNGTQVTDLRRMPQLFFDVREEEDFKNIADALPNLVKVGIPITVAWAQRKLGIPARVGEEPILVESVPNPVAANRFSALRAQPMSTLAALMVKQNGDIYPDQTALDVSVDQLSAAQLQQQSEQMLGVMIARLSAAKSDDEALGMLAESFPDMDVSELAQCLGDRLFIARLVGMFSAQQERDE
ncbi:MAG: DUF935 domain-containing protein, partial [Undibacterium sp.]|nr:DUF935 domain-containing protein [Undibacterium sp.]